MDDTPFTENLTAKVPPDLANAVREAAIARGITVADFLRGAAQARLMLDGYPFNHIPNLRRTTYCTARPRV